MGEKKKKKKKSWALSTKNERKQSCFLKEVNNLAIQMLNWQPQVLVTINITVLLFLGG